MKIVNIKDNSKDRIFRNIDALRKLIKSKGIFYSGSKFHLSGIIMTSKSNGLKIKYSEFNDGNICKEISEVKVINGIIHA